MNPTIHDVAKRANVSISTVSRVVNNPKAVRKEKRDRVLQAIEELGYVPNPFASGLREHRTMTIVAMIPDIAAPFYAEMFRGIEDIARDYRNNVIICNTDHSVERLQEYMRYFKKKKVDGVIFASEPVTGACRECFRELGVPVLLAATESSEDDLPSVKVDDYEAAYDAAVFVMKNGHERIAMISGPLEDPIAGRPRHDGFRQALRDHGVTFEDQQVEFGSFDFDSGYEAMAKLYGRMPDVTVVFAAADEMALGALAFLQRRGLEVPRQVSVIGFDNLAVSRMVTPPLTTVAQPIGEIGRTAARLLFQWIESGEPPASVRLPHEIVVRDTVWNRL
jgi:LacI family transcriptional regulator